MEGEQFLLQATDIAGVIEWIEVRYALIANSSLFRGPLCSCISLQLLYVIGNALRHGLVLNGALCLFRACKLPLISRWISTNA
jgi:hypothetical protein